MSVSGFFKYKWDYQLSEKIFLYIFYSCLIFYLGMNIFKRFNYYNNNKIFNYIFLKKDIISIDSESYL